MIKLCYNLYHLLTASIILIFDLPAEGPWSIVDSFLPTRLAARALCEPNCEEQLKAWSLLSDDLWNDALAHARKQTYKHVDNQFDPAEDGMCNICGDFFAAVDLSHCSSCYSNYCDNCWLHAHEHSTNAVLLYILLLKKTGRK